MKVLLINPPFNSFSASQPPEVLFPLSLGYLAAMLLQETGAEVEILDCVVEDFTCRPYKDTKFFNFGLTLNALKERIAGVAPDIVGITCSFTKRWTNCLDVAGAAKAVNPRIRVVVGGAHPSSLPTECLDGAVDDVVVGEGEIALTNIVKNGESVRRFHRFPYLPNLDSLPKPARHLVDMAPYTSGARDSVITSRGCPYECSYCSVSCVWGRKWRARSPQGVVEEVESIINEYSLDVISFMDDNMTLSRGRMLAICDEIEQRGLNFYWNIPNGSHVGHLDKELIERMRRAGLYALNLAIESGDERILHEVMNKQIELDQVRRVVGWAKELNILTLGYFVFGMPGETVESARKTMEFAKELELDCVNGLVATPYPGSPLWELCLERGWLASTNFDEYTAFDPVIETEWLKPQEVQELVEEFRSSYPEREGVKETIRRPTKAKIEACLEKERVR